MPDREKVIKALENCTGEPKCRDCPWEECEDFGHSAGNYPNGLIKDALELLKAQEARHRLEVHNIGNVDIPEGVTWEQFQAVMTGVVAALEYTDRGESWPYEEGNNDA